MHRHASQLRCSSPALVDGEAVEAAGAAGGDQVLLAAAAARMRRVPRDVAAARAIVVAELRAAHACPVLLVQLEQVWSIASV